MRDRVEVVVDGALWREVADFAHAGPADEVYVLDPKTGTVLFGDGVHGRTPAAGSSVELDAYREGSGARGNTSHAVRLADCGTVRITTRVTPAEEDSTSSRGGCLTSATGLVAIAAGMAVAAAVRAGGGNHRP